MGKAEFGTPKGIQKRMNAGRLNRHRFYCAICEQDNRDENGLKMHTQSEKHVRRVDLIAGDLTGWTETQSEKFKQEFISLLKTSHGEKEIQINRFYQELITDRYHTHLNSTKWSSLTEFAKYLGREAICRVEDIPEKGIYIAWIDDSPEALRRKEALKRKAAQTEGDEETERRAIREQVRRAQEAKREKKGAGAGEGEDGEEKREADEDDNRQLRRDGTERITLSLGGAKRVAASRDGHSKDATDKRQQLFRTDRPPEDDKSRDLGKDYKSGHVTAAEERADEAPDEAPVAPAGLGLSLKQTGGGRARNVFGGDSDDEDDDGAPSKKIPHGKKMSAAERIMRDEQERKRLRGGGRESVGFGMPPGKRHRPDPGRR